MGRMKDGPNIAGIAALIGDRSRSEILTALLGAPFLVRIARRMAP